MKLSRDPNFPALPYISAFNIKNIIFIPSHLNFRFGCPTLMLNILLKFTCITLKLSHLIKEL